MPGLTRALLRHAHHLPGRGHGCEVLLTADADRLRPKMETIANGRQKTTGLRLVIEELLAQPVLESLPGLPAQQNSLLGPQQR